MAEYTKKQKKVAAQGAALGVGGVAAGYGGAHAFNSSRRNTVRAYNKSKDFEWEHKYAYDKAKKSIAANQTAGEHYSRGQIPQTLIHRQKAGEYRTAAMEAMDAAGKSNAKAVKYLKTAKKQKLGAAALGVTALGALGSIERDIKSENLAKKPIKKSSRILSDAEIRRRKKTQATTSKVTGALGLAALGGTALATKPGQHVLRSGFKAAGKKVPKHLVAKPAEPGLRNSVTPLLATSAGLGALGSFNFARYTEAESRKRPRLTPVPEKRKKTVAKRYDDYTSPFDDPVFSGSTSTDLQGPRD